MIKTNIPRDLTGWQKKYEPGFVMYSIKSGKVLAAARDYQSLEKKAERKKIRRELASVVYVPDIHTISIF